MLTLSMVQILQKAIQPALRQESIDSELWRANEQLTKMIKRATSSAPVYVDCPIPIALTVGEVPDDAQVFTELGTAGSCRVGVHNLRAIYGEHSVDDFGNIAAIIPR
jgi:hypothetical protein